MKKKIRKLLIFCAFFTSFIFITLLVLSFTSVPFWTRYWLGTSNSRYNFEPQFIIMLGGGSMPCSENLMRLYYTSLVAKKYETAKIIIAQPDYDSSNAIMLDYLTKLGIDSKRVQFESLGLNTRMQALNISEKFQQITDSNCIIVTSPEHMRRSIFSFQKVGFKHIGGFSAFENNPTIDISLKNSKLGGRKYIPGFGYSSKLRYDFWNYFIDEIKIIREFSAILYYRLKDWI